jgi:hypothetical protein
MRLSGWRAGASHKDATAPKVMAVVQPVLTGLGAESDPPCWVAWGDDPATRYSILAISDGGLVTCNVRVNVPQEGPRASGKLVRWSRVQTGELSVDIQGSHRLVGFQVEGQIMRAIDGEADAVTEFALDIFAAIDGRPLPSLAGDVTAAPKGKSG